jgi:hypothetical protein
MAVNELILKDIIQMNKENGRGNIRHKFETGQLIDKCSANLKRLDGNSAIRKANNKPSKPFFVFNLFIHMCIHCLGHFSPLPPTYSFFPCTPPLFQAQPVLPLSLISLKRKHKQY